MRRESDDPKVRSTVSPEDAHPDVPVLGPLAGGFAWDVLEDSWWWSDELYALHGLQRGDVVPTLDLQLSHKHPEDREKVERVLVCALEREGSFSCYHRIFDARGGLKHVLSVGESHTDPAGRVIEITGFMVDITQARHDDLEKHVQATMDAVLEHRSEIDMAKGAIMSGYGFSADDAFAVLKAASSNSNIKLHEVARRVVSSLSDATPTAEGHGRMEALLTWVTSPEYGD